MSDAAAATVTPTQGATAPATPVAGTATTTPVDHAATAIEIARKAIARGGEPPAPAAGTEETQTEGATEEHTERPKDEPEEKPEPTGKAFKKLRLREQAVKDLERKVQDGLGELARWKAERESDEKLKADDPYGWARKHGFNFRELAKKAVGEETQDPRDKAIAELRAELAELKGESTTRKERERTDGVATANAEIRAVAATEFAKTTPDDFPYLHAHEPSQVAEAIRVELVEHYQRTGEELAPRQVMARLEKQMAEYVGGIHGKVASRKKPAEEPAPPHPKPKRPENADVTSRAAAGRVTPKGPLTDEERIARATARARDIIRR